MSSLFADLWEGLEEAIAYEKGEGEAWEDERTHPTGPVFSLLGILASNTEKEYIVKKKDNRWIKPKDCDKL